MEFISAIPMLTGPDVVLHQEYTDRPLGTGLSCQFAQCSYPAYHRLWVGTLQTLACQNDHHYRQMGLVLVNQYAREHPELYRVKGN